MTRPRYRDEASILKHIDDTKALAVSKLAQAELLKDASMNWFREAAREDLSQEDMMSAKLNGLAALENSKKLGKAATNLLEKKLPKLGVKLAQMRTDIMSFLPDRSIVR